jgi:hypothetical protein
MLPFLKLQYIADAKNLGSGVKILVRDRRSALQVFEAQRENLQSIAKRRQVTCSVIFAACWGWHATKQAFSKIATH